jgi:hypothetical protein
MMRCVARKFAFALWLRQRLVVRQRMQMMPAGLRGQMPRALPKTLNQMKLDTSGAASFWYFETLYIYRYLYVYTYIYIRYNKLSN